MKKNILIIVSVIIVFALTACSSQTAEKTSAADDEWITSAEVDITAAKLELVPSSKTARAGDIIKLTLRLTDCVWFTDMTLNISYPKEYARCTASTALFDSANLYDAFNADNGNIYYSLMSQTAETLNGECAEFTIELGEDVPAGTVLDFAFAADCIYSAASDALGVNTDNITDEISFIPCSVTIE